MWLLADYLVCGSSAKNMEMCCVNFAKGVLSAKQAKCVVCNNISSVSGGTKQVEKKLQLALHIGQCIFFLYVLSRKMMG